MRSCLSNRPLLIFWKTAFVACLLGMSGLAAQAQTYKLKFATVDAQTDDNFSVAAQKTFAKEVKEKSGGRIDMTIYWNGQLGKIENLVNQISSGLVEGQIASEGHLAPYFPDGQVLGIPYLFRSREVAHKVLDGPFGQKLAEAMAAKSGNRPVAWLENGGFRHFSANKPLTSAASIRGLKIRTMSNPVHMEIVKSLGASPTPVPWTDLYTSLQSGVVDGQENSISTFRIPRLEEVQKYMITDGHVYAVLAIFVSEKFYQKLPADLKKVVLDAGAAARTVNREIAAKNESADRAYLEKAGVKIYDPTPQQKAEFQKLTQGPAIDSLVKQGVSRALIDEMMAEIAKAEQELGLAK
jgi:tripartite ATP-independent transporter DctP family solute receptor